MKRVVSVLLVVIVLGGFQFAVAEDLRSLDTVNWEAFSENLINAFQVGNEGVKLAAMQNIIKYGDYLNVKDAARELVRIYRHHPNQRVRQMAVVALHKVNSNWGMYFLKRNLQFEDNPTIRHQILACLQEKMKSSPADNNTQIAELTK